VNGDPDYNAAAQFGDTRIDAQVFDNVNAGVFSLETGGKTLVSAGNTSTGPGKGDLYTMRLTSPPSADVNVDVVTDGQTDIDYTDLQAGGRISAPMKIGGPQAIQLFKGNIVISGSTITRGSGSETGSFLDEGFLPKQRIRLEGAGAANGDYYIAATPGSVTASTITLTTSPAANTYNDVVLSELTDRGLYISPALFPVEYKVANAPFLMFTGDLTARGTTISRTKGNSINDNFAPGEKIRIKNKDSMAVGVGDFTIVSLSADGKSMTLNAAPGDGSYPSATISKLLDTLRRTDGG